LCGWLWKVKFWSWILFLLIRGWKGFTNYVSYTVHTDWLFTVGAMYGSFLVKIFNFANLRGLRVNLGSAEALQTGSNNLIVEKGIYCQLICCIMCWPIWLDINKRIFKILDIFQDRLCTTGFFSPMLDWCTITIFLWNFKIL
jgi:hypothetical protein